MNCPKDPPNLGKKHREFPRTIVERTFIRPGEQSDQSRKMLLDDSMSSVSKGENEASRLPDMLDHIESFISSNSLMMN